MGDSSTGACCAVSSDSNVPADSSKSPKRKAAEAALAGRLSSDLCDEEGSKAKRHCVLALRPLNLEIPPCTGPISARSCSSATNTTPCGPWCGFGVSLLQAEWDSVAPAGSQAEAAGQRLALGQGVAAILVEQAQQLAPALRALKASMQDPVIALDLEWRPDFRRGSQSRVALVQLASSSLVLLVRTCRLEAEMPEELGAFLRDPAHVVVGHGWDASDERKFKASFGVGRSIVPRFLDLQAVSRGWGCGAGLCTLAQHFLGVRYTKSRKVSMSNWEARTLSRGQLLYAALDALLAGAVFRALRALHASSVQEGLAPGPAAQHTAAR